MTDKPEKHLIKSLNDLDKLFPGRMVEQADKPYLPVNPCEKSAHIRCNDCEKNLVNCVYWIEYFAAKTYQKKLLEYQKAHPEISADSMLKDLEEKWK